MISVRYHEAAEEELLSEIAYLDTRAPGLARRFFAEVRRSEDLIGLFPEAGNEIASGIRRVILRRFRYSLIYSIDSQGALILAVAHHRRRPGYWLQRMR